MRYRLMKSAFMLGGLLLGATSPAKAQSSNNYDFSGMPANPVPLPIGPDRAGQGGFYAAFEAVFMQQTKAIGSQDVAIRGYKEAQTFSVVSTPIFVTEVLIVTTIDIFGNIIQTPTPTLVNVGSSVTATAVPSNVFRGSGAVALTTATLTGRSTYSPGFQTTIGYKFADGMAISWSFLQLSEAKYQAGASGPGAPGSVFGTPGDLVPGFGNGRFGNAFLFSPVSNATPFFNGPSQQRTFQDYSNFNLLNSVGSEITGIWSGATYMEISYLQRFTNSDITVRMPIFETDYSRTYALTGGRFSWIFERFKWRTVAAQIDGSASDADAAIYSNTLSQRMYGAFVGCGNEVYLGNNFAGSLDLTGSFLVDLVKERVKYERQDRFTESKRSLDTYTIVPNLNIAPSVWWYPVKGVQIKATYEAQLYFNTTAMDKPIGFDFGNIDPGYTTKTLRLVQGIKLGLGISF